MLGKGDQTCSVTHAFMSQREVRELALNNLGLNALYKNIAMLPPRVHNRPIRVFLGQVKGNRSITLQLVELLRRLRVALGILSSDGKVHSMPLSNITANHPLVTNILPNLSPQL